MTHRSRTCRWAGALSGAAGRPRPTGIAVSGGVRPELCWWHAGRPAKEEGLSDWPVPQWFEAAVWYTVSRGFDSRQTSGKEEEEENVPRAPLPCRFSSVRALGISRVLAFHAFPSPCPTHRGCDPGPSLVPPRACCPPSPTHWARLQVEAQRTCALVGMSALRARCAHATTEWANFGL